MQNLNLTWYTENPDFTKCFQKTALIWIPCAFLWIFSLFDIYYIRNSINRNIPWGFLNTAKSILTSSLIVLTCIDLIIVSVNQQQYYTNPADFYSPIIKIATFVSCFIFFSLLSWRCNVICWLKFQILSLGLLHYNQRNGLRISGVQFLFWLLLVICGTPQLRTQILDRQEREAYSMLDKNDEYHFTSYLIFFVMSAIMWFLNWFADSAPQYTKYATSDVS